MLAGRKTDAQTAATHATKRDEVQRFQEGKSRAVSRSLARCLLSNYGRKGRFPASASLAKIKGNK